MEHQFVSLPSKDGACPHPFPHHTASGLDGGKPHPYWLEKKVENVGVERAVTRWYVLHQVLSDEVERLEASIALSSQQEDAAASHEKAALHKHLREARERLRLLGPCPRPMMG
jgi:hypothetical protein